MEETKKVYGVYHGCIYEGGGVRSPLYFKKEDAIKQAEKDVRKEKRDHKRDFNNSDKKAYDIRHFEEYRWRKKCSIEDYWENTVDCISVQEFDIK